MAVMASPKSTRSSVIRDARAHQIVEGTNEIMRVIIARAILEEGAVQRLR